jgi:hypothetical protein
VARGQWPIAKPGGRTVFRVFTVKTTAKSPETGRIGNLTYPEEDLDGQAEHHR